VVTPALGCLSRASQRGASVGERGGGCALQKLGTGGP